MAIKFGSREEGTVVCRPLETQYQQVHRSVDLIQNGFYKGIYREVLLASKISVSLSIDTVAVEKIAYFLWFLQHQFKSSQQLGLLLVSRVKVGKMTWFAFVYYS